MRTLKLAGLLVGAVLLLPSGAHAATLTNSGGTLTYSAAGGATNLVGFNQTGPTTVEVHRFAAIGDDDPITTATGCTQATPADPYVCTGVTRVSATAGDGDDAVDAGGALALETGGAVPETVLTSIPLQAELDAGDDRASGGRAGDSIGGGEGDDQMLLDGLGFATGTGGDDEGFGDEGNDSINGGRGNDLVEGGEGADSVAGGPGTDELFGDEGADFLAAGPGDDALDGGDGNDTLTGECDQMPCPNPAGGDDIVGGAGFDLFRYESYGPAAVTITIDGVRNDGAAGEGDNVHTDVEDVEVTGPAPATVTGSSGFNSLATGSGTDVVNSADGGPDRVSCGGGSSDTANADDVDVVNSDCESVNRTTSGFNEDKPPTVAWSVPASGARLSTTAANPLAVTASDDKGIARVEFLDDERTVCSDATAPYTCDYRPQGDDVGRNTLVAIAVDTSGQTASAVRAVRVPRFVGRLSARTRPRRDTTAPYRFTTTGRLRLPVGVTQAQGCRGTVTVQFKAGRKTVSTRRAKLRRDCTYRSRVTFRIKQRLRPRTLRRSARFGGNAVMAARSASRQRLRIR